MMTATTPPGPGQHERFGISVDCDAHRVTVELSGILDEDGAGLIALWLTPLVLFDRRRMVVIHIGLLAMISVEGLSTLIELVELAQLRRCDLRFVAGSAGRAVPLRLDGPARLILDELVRRLPAQDEPGDPQPP
jgi:hypothetical protein